VAVFPYESQWGDLACNAPLIEHGADPAEYFDWRADGYPSVEEYRFWARHVCGLASLRSVLRGWFSESSPMYDLVRAAERHGALVRRDDTVDGLYYRPFLVWARAELGLDGEVVEHAEAEEALRLIDEDRVFLASVSPEIRYPDRPNLRRGGHLVLAHRFDGATVTFHNPSGVRDTAEDARLDVATFARFFAGRGVTLRRVG